MNLPLSPLNPFSPGNPGSPFCPFSRWMLIQPLSPGGPLSPSSQTCGMEVNPHEWHVLKINFSNNFPNRESLQILMWFSVVSAGSLLTEFITLLLLFSWFSSNPCDVKSELFPACLEYERWQIVLSISQCTVCDCTLEMVILFTTLIFRDVKEHRQYDRKLEKYLKFQMCAGQISRLVWTGD